MIMNAITNSLVSWLQEVQLLVDFNVLIILVIIFLFFLMYFLERVNSNRLDDFKEKFEALFEYSTISYGVMDRLDIIDSNTAAIQLFYFADKEQFIKHSFTDLSTEIQPDGSKSNEKIKDLLQTAIKEGFNRFEWNFRKINGIEFPGEVNLSRFSLGGKSLLLLSIYDLSERKQRELEIIQTMERVQKQQTTIINISTNIIRSDIDFKLACQKIIEATALAVNADRVGYWMVDDPTNHLECLNLFERTKNFHANRGILNLDAYPFFMKAVSSGRAIDAFDALNDVRISELKELYIVPLGIMSFLVSPVRNSGKIVGIVFIEQISFKRKWLSDEIRFAAEIADQLTQLILNNDQKLMEQALRKSEEQYRSFIVQAVDAIFMHDYQGKFIDVNKAACDLVGYGREELLKMSIFDIDKDAVLQDVIFSMWNHLPKTYETNYTRKDRFVIPIEVRLGKLEIADKTMIQVVARNIFERKKTEELIKHQAILLENVNEAVISMDEKMVITSWNHVAEEIYGWKREEVLGKNAIDVFKTTYSTTNHHEVIQELSDRGFWKGEVIQSKKDGTLIHVHASSSSIKDQKGRILEYLTVNLDITDRINIDLMKDEFVSMVSHELRTPLTAIKESTNLILNGLAGNINDMQKDLLTTGKRNLDRLTRLINDVLDLQKLQTGKFDMQKDLNNINQIIEETRETMFPLSQVKKLDLRFNLDRSIPLFYFDRDKMTQVILNLVHNAIKFTNEGYIEINSKKVDEHSILIEVMDTGIGIQPEDRNRIFESFVQVSPTEFRKAGGSGLGLAISREIIQRHNGSIHVESNQENGSSFIIFLPIQSNKE